MAELMTVLVTGGAGYIGSVVTGRLLRDGLRVRVLDNLTYGGGSLLSYLHHPSFELAVGDIRKSADVEVALNGVDAVVHLAAIVGDPACAKYPAEAREVNLVGSELVYERALGHGVRRFIFASTCSNYGKSSVSGALVDESSPLNPVSLYAELKVAVEKSLLDLRRESFSPTCLRFATAYGLSPRPRFDLTVNEFTRDMTLGRKLEVYGEQFWRPYSHTADLATAISLVLRADESTVAYESFNVGATNENYQKKTLVDLISHELSGRHGEVAFVRKDEDPRDYRVNCAKLADRLGFKISRTVPDGIAEIIRAIRTGLIDNPDDPKCRNR